MEQNVLLAIEAMSNLDHMAKSAAHYGYRLRVLASDPTYYGHVSQAEVIAFPTHHTDALITYISERRQEIAQVFSVTDTWGITAARLRDHFGFPQFAPVSELQRLADKQQVLDPLRASQRVPKLDPDTWPQILKPRHGTGKCGVHLVTSAAEFAELQQQPDYVPTNFVRQPYYQGPLYSAEVWCDDTTRVFFGVTNRIISNPPDFTERVKSFPWEPDTPWESRVKQWVWQVLDTLDYQLGLAHIEFIDTHDGFALVEINPRMAGALITPSITQATNYDPYALAIEQALGAALHVPQTREIVQGMSHASLYASQTGTFESVIGLERLKSYPGNPQWLPTKDCGATITELGTYKARLGNVLASGATAALAQDHAIAAAQALQVHISPTKQTGV